MSNWFVEPMKDEVPYSEIFKKAENGEFHKWNFQPVEEFQANGYEDVLDEIKKYTAVDYLHLRELRDKAEKEGDKEAAQEYADKMEAMTQAVMKIYRDKNIFPIQYFSEFGILDEIAKCIAYKAEFDGNTVSCVTGDTEFFNGKEWKRIDEYVEGDKVLQYNPDGTATLVDPLRYIHYQSDDPFYRYSIFSPYMTENHNIVRVLDDGKLCLISLGDLFSMDEDIEIPVSTEYVEGISVSREVLLDTYAAVVWQDKKFMTIYNTEDENGYVTLSEECFNLSINCRLLLLNLFGINDEVIDSCLRRDFNTTQNYWSPANTMSESLFKVISNLISLSYKNVELEAVFKNGKNISTASFDSSDYLISEIEEWDKLDGVKDKYCFSVPSHMLVLRYEGRVYITGNCGAGIGTSLCNYLFPNLYDTPSAHDLDKENARSLFEKFHNDKYLRRAIEFCFGYKNGCPVPTSVTGGLRLVGSAPTNFRPMNAKAIYERFCPKGGTIYDFCCVSGDTEYFNGYEWKRIDQYDHDKVLQYNDDGTATLVTPESYIFYENNEPFYEYVSTGHLRSMQTGNHDVVYRSCNGKVLGKIKQDQILDGFEGLIPISIKYNGSGENPDDAVIRNIAGYLSDYLTSNGRQYFEDCYTWSVESKRKLCKYIFDDSDTVFVKEEFVANYISDMLRMSGEVASILKEKKGFKITWLTKKYKREEWYASYDCIHGEFKEVNERKKYCFVVPSHMLVLRRKGEIYVTGNCGFGGRLLGALSSKNNYRYVGTDPCTETMYHLHQLGEYIEQVTGREDSYELHCCGSEEFIGPEKSIDFAFSSPPYFNLEVYSDEPTQCFNKFPELDEWLEGYVRATIKNIKHMLKSGKFYAVNIADFKVGSGKTVAYVDEWIRISTEEGMPLFDTVYLGVTARAGSAEQAAGELKKENILIFKKPLW